MSIEKAAAVDSIAARLQSFVHGAFESNPEYSRMSEELEEDKARFDDLLSDLITVATGVAPSDSPADSQGHGASQREPMPVLALSREHVGAAPAGGEATSENGLGNPPRAVDADRSTAGPSGAIKRLRAAFDQARFAGPNQGTAALVEFEAALHDVEALLDGGRASTDMAWRLLNAAHQGTVKAVAMGESLFVSLDGIAEQRDALRVRFTDAVVERDGLRAALRVLSDEKALLIHDLESYRKDLRETRGALTGLYRACLKYFEHNGADHEDNECPEDDTCECPIVVAVNEAFEAARPHVDWS